MFNVFKGKMIVQSQKEGNFENTTAKLSLKFKFPIDIRALINLDGVTV